MPRNITSNYLLALQEGYLFPCIFLEIYFASGPVRICTASQGQILNGNAYIGVGSFLDLSTIEDGSTVQARGVSVTLSGIDPVLLPATLNEFQVGLSATIYLGLFGGEALSLVNETVIAWQGRTDQPTITVDEKSASIQMNLESVFLDMNVPVPYRYTNQDQQLFSPGDLGFQWVNSIQSISVYWGQPTNSNPGTP
jgi:hypothetical protein